MIPILELSPAELRDWFVQHGLPAYRAGQVRKWLLQKRAAGFEEMTDLPAKLREQLAAEFQPFSTTVAKHHKAADGAEKLLLQLHDAERIECVLLRDDKGHCTACISTQVGCAMGCVFCATGLDGVVRNLTRGEIVEQILHIQRLLKGPARRCTSAPCLAPASTPGGKTQMGDGRSVPAWTPGLNESSSGSKQDQLKTAERLSHIVVMGMGEPLLNLDSLLPALAEAAGRDGLGIGARRITISTVGLPAGIQRLARGAEKGSGPICRNGPEGAAHKLDLTPFPPYHLAVSLHAADDELRSQLVPANRGFGVAAILAAADEYFELTGRRATFEYVLLSGVNDRPEHARRLVALLRGRPALVNLIPYNPVPGLPYRKPSSAATARFVDVLTQGGLNVAIRHRKGDRIGAACGQLRRRS
ncbi:MAG: 23S rRNA (adenine(2503)-C(2))-methyltransferase RlmN [Planctomycetes bacterium]|nr:23S rRNA (adenine(2503)-C(2))-methyltransferase RlmN [Planctomycetota bacterium]MBU4397861.1 23S rRNA (adenine(2503)-C(2))-methyltransferase RlmN [Planctomycetota bacterium]MCG2683599.1 23S rRNA (adenine(2503)-C(2))-methyltransferase RlmN [Planctomycetales bacterium]